MAKYENTKTTNDATTDRINQEWLFLMASQISRPRINILLQIYRDHHEDSWAIAKKSICKYISTYLYLCQIQKPNNSEIR